MATISPTGEDALAFLAKQALEPTPQNYAFAYIALNEPNSQIARTVNEMAIEGLRIKQSEADEIIALYASDTIRAVPNTASAERKALQMQASRLSEMTADAAAASQDFARDLDAEAQGFDQEAARTVQIVSRMIERSKQAEDKFRSALQKIEELRQEVESARDEAERDSLTNLPNRRCVERHLQQLADSGVARTIGMCDIDHFKDFNDRFGHAVGDRVLQMVASTLETSCAPHFVGRWGGEEFVIIAAGDDQNSCVRLLDSARADLASRNFKLRETDQPLSRITFSAGVAVAYGSDSENSAALHRADASMYSAKAAGRNQVLAA